MIIFYKIIIKIIISMHIKEGTELYVIMNTFQGDYCPINNMHRNIKDHYGTGEF